MKHFVFSIGLLALLVCGCCTAPYSDKELEEACLNGTLNVFMFGAKGDGVTDDTQAIQRGIDFLNGKTLADVPVPAGENGEEADADGGYVRVFGEERFLGMAVYTADGSSLKPHKVLAPEIKEEWLQSRK